jgi:hypothetical protein
MKPYPCFEPNKELLAAAARAEERKNQAIDKIMGKLGPKGSFEQAMHELIDADPSTSLRTGKRALEEKGQ